MAISVVFAFLLYFGPSVLPKDYDIDIIGLGEDTNIPIHIGTALTWTYVLIVLAAISAVIFPLVFFNFKKAKGTLIGLAGLVVVLLIAYLFSGSEVFGITGIEPEKITPGLIKTVGTGLNMMYLMMGLAFLSIIYVEIAKMFK
ncbi:MAG TPA: hypothetical protein DEA97_03745 [Bacteroidales bacterium]|nr:hypothetical protein [Bacteroidales bacterium]